MVRLRHWDKNRNVGSPALLKFNQLLLRRPTFIPDFFRNFSGEASRRFSPATKYLSGFFRPPNKRNATTVATLPNEINSSSSKNWQICSESCNTFDDKSQFQPLEWKKTKKDRTEPKRQQQRPPRDFSACPGSAEPRFAPQIPVRDRKGRLRGFVFAFATRGSKNIAFAKTIFSSKVFFLIWGTSATFTHNLDTIGTLYNSHFYNLQIKQQDDLTSSL